MLGQAASLSAQKPLQSLKNLKPMSQHWFKIHRTVLLEHVGQPLQIGESAQIKLELALSLPSP